MINGKIIKVCGMREAENIKDLEASGEVDMMGFIFYPKSPRYVSERPSYLPAHTDRVGVFVNESEQVVMTYAHRFGLKYIQLHGNESPEYCRYVSAQGLKVIKAFSIAHILDLTNVGNYEGSCNYFLFDTKSEQHGGSGHQFDWNILHAYHEETPFLLSGGIDLHSVEALKNFTHPRLAGYDINSRFERKPGEKDIKRVREFLDKLTIK